MRRLDIVPMYVTDRREALGKLGTRLERAFGVEVRVIRPWFDPELAYDASRGQHNSTVLLRMLLDGATDDGARLLGVTAVDLFIPVLTFVFGEAQLQGQVAVVSLHRLRPEVYGLPADDELLDARLEKEAVHELGHTLGLVHCMDAACVMRPSTYVEQIDLKPASFCSSCVAVVNEARSSSYA